VRGASAEVIEARTAEPRIAYFTFVLRGLEDYADPQQASASAPRRKPWTVLNRPGGAVFQCGTTDFHPHVRMEFWSGEPPAPPGAWDTRDSGSARSYTRHAPAGFSESSGATTPGSLRCLSTASTCRASSAFMRSPHLGRLRTDSLAPLGAADGARERARRDRLATCYGEHAGCGREIVAEHTGYVGAITHDLARW
jgi:hypothetical protein